MANKYWRGFGTGSSVWTLASNWADTIDYTIPATAVPGVDDACPSI